MAELPISSDDAGSEIKALIVEKGIESLTGKVIRKYLEAKFNCSLSAHKAEIDRITMEKIEELNKQKAKNESFDSGSESDNESNDEDDQEEDKDAKLDISKKESRKRKASSDDDSDFDAPADVKRTRSSKSKPADKGKAGTVKKRKDTAFTRLCELSNELQEVTGRKYMRRHDVVKHMWAYFKNNNLMDPKDRRKVICDEPLRRIFGLKKIQAFGMMGGLKEHITDATNLSDEEREKILAELEPERPEGADSDDDKINKKKKTTKGTRRGRSEGAPRRETAFTKLMILSDELAGVLGHKYMRRHHVVKAMWAYFKNNDLMDANDRRMVVVSEELKPIFEGEKKIQAFGMMRFLKGHMDSAESLGEQERKQIEAKLDAKYGDDKTKSTENKEATTSNAVNKLKKKVAEKEVSSSSSSGSSSDEEEKEEENDGEGGGDVAKSEAKEPDSSSESSASSSDE